MISSPRCSPSLSHTRNLDGMASAFGPPLLLLIIIIIMASMSLKSSFAYEDNVSMMMPAVAEIRPVASAGLQTVLFNETRRRLGSFKICALCTCCGGPKGLCLPSPCCYAINCNIPNRPFGYCAFTPKSCNCLGCHL